VAHSTPPGGPLWLRRALAPPCGCHLKPLFLGGFWTRARGPPPTSPSGRRPALAARARRPAGRTLPARAPALRGGGRPGERASEQSRIARDAQVQAWPRGGRYRVLWIRLRARARTRVPACGAAARGWGLPARPRARVADRPSGLTGRRAGDLG
jgi:hypothetical protein